MTVPGWWIVAADRWIGPLDEADLLRRAKAGEMNGDTLVWGHDVSDWTALGEVPQLEPVLQACSPESRTVTRRDPHGVREVLFLPAATPDLAAWLRMFARGIDFALFGGLFLLFALPSWGDAHSARSLILPLTLTAPLALLIEVFVLSLFGTTPGKMIFGISVTTPDGRKPPLLLSLKRCFWLWVWGLGLNIPLLNLVGLIAFHDTLSRGETTRWDAKSGLVLHQRNISALCGAVGVLLFLTLCIAPVGLSKFGQ